MPKATPPAPSPVRPVAVDLFAGAGGLSLGFEQAGFDVLAAVDNDPVHLAVHEFNFPRTHPLCADVAALTKSQLHAAARKGWGQHNNEGEWDGQLDCVFGGPSCQGFSDMGTRTLKDPRNQLILSFGRVVCELRPKTFVMENVPGLLFKNARPLLDRLKGMLDEAGYTFVDSGPFVLDAAEFGVPQARRRAFLVGHLEGFEPTEIEPCGRVTVSDALDDLPNIGSGIGRNTRALTTGELKALNETVSPFVASLRTGFSFEYCREWDPSLLTGMSPTAHSRATVSRLRKLVPGEFYPQGRTRRLQADSQSPTLRAGTGRDHGSYTAARPIHHREDRVITVREAARLHSFPDWFRFHETKWHALRQIGNSVPPRLAYAVARSFMSEAPMERNLEATCRTSSEDLLSLSLVGAAVHFGLSLVDLPRDVRRVSPPQGSTGRRR